MGLVDRVHRLKARKGMALLSLVIAFGTVALLMVISGSMRLRQLRSFSKRLNEKRKWRMQAQSALAEGLVMARNELQEGNYQKRSSLPQVEGIEITVGKPKKTVGLVVGQLVIAAKVKTPAGGLIAAERRVYSIRLGKSAIGRRAIQRSEEVQR